jgi:hypothetical protein
LDFVFLDFVFALAVFLDFLDLDGAVMLALESEALLLADALLLVSAL